MSALKELFIGGSTEHGMCVDEMDPKLFGYVYPDEQPQPPATPAPKAVKVPARTPAGSKRPKAKKG